MLLLILLPSEASWPPNHCPATRLDDLGRLRSEGSARQIDQDRLSTKRQSLSHTGGEHTLANYPIIVILASKCATLSDISSFFRHLVTARSRSCTSAQPPSTAGALGTPRHAPGTAPRRLSVPVDHPPGRTGGSAPTPAR